LTAQANFLATATEGCKSQHISVQFLQFLAVSAHADG